MRIVAQDGGRLSVVHVARPPWTQFRFRAPALADDPEFQKNYRDSVQQRLEDFCRPSSPETNRAKPTYHVLEAGNHGAAIVEFIAQTGADLVALGTRGRANLREILLGMTWQLVMSAT